MSQPEKQVKNIQSVHRALDILEYVCENVQGCKLGDIADHCELNKTTAFHLLKTLEARGYVEQSYDTQLYKAGWKVLDTFTDFYQKVDIRPIALPYMDKIRDLTNETVSLYFFSRVDDYYMGTCMIQIESTQQLKFSSKLGSRIPVHCTAPGKVRLLGYTDEMLKDQLGKMPFTAYTPATITDPDALLQQLPDIRQKGYCIEREEYISGLSSVSAPLFKYTGRVIYAMTVTIPSSRASEERLEEISKIVMEALSVPSGYPDFIFKGAPL